VGNILKKNKGSNIGSCPQVPVGHIKVIVYQYGNKTTGEAYVTLLTKQVLKSIIFQDIFSELSRRLHVYNAVDTDYPFDRLVCPTETLS
jgi:hypothetical protein